MVVPPLVMWPVLYVAGNVTIHCGDAATVTVHVKGFMCKEGTCSTSHICVGRSWRRFIGSKKQ